MNPVLDMSLSFEARGVVAYLQASQQESITVEVMRSLGLGRDTSYRVACELELRGYFLKSGKGLYTFLNSVSSTPELPESRNFLNSGIQEVAQHAYIESRVLDSESGHVVENTETSGIPEFRKFESEPHQQTLDGLPGTPPPSSATPPAPARPKRTRRQNPDAAKALYPAIFELCKSGQRGGKSMACRNLARDLAAEFQATPEQVAAFWLWFKEFSRPAQIAAREQRPLNAPMPRQVYEAWPQFVPWWQARQDELARQAQRRRREEPPAGGCTPASDPDAPLRDRERIAALNPYRNRLRKPAVL